MSASAEVGALALAEANDSVAYSLLGELLTKVIILLLEEHRYSAVPLDLLRIYFV